jgi:hypothetical protein
MLTGLRLALRKLKRLCSVATGAVTLTFYDR